MALNSGIQTYQILTNDDEVCIPCLSSILLAVSLRLNCVSRTKQIIQHLSRGIILVLRTGVGTLKLQKYAHFIGQAFPINPRRKRALFIRRFEQNTG